MATVFLVGAVLALLLAALLAARVPSTPRAAQQLRYPSLIAADFHIVVADRPLRVAMALGAARFGLFTMFWTALTFPAERPAPRLPDLAIGLFGLAVLAGAQLSERASDAYVGAAAAWSGDSRCSEAFSEPYRAPVSSTSVLP